MSGLKRTPLYEMHIKYGGMMVDFGGWELPVRYKGKGDLEEHKAVRERVGLFDVSHMGEIRVKGPEALKFMDHLVTNDISKAAMNQVTYAFMCYPEGGVVDDLLVYKLSDEEFFLVVNASNSDKDYEWVSQQAKGFNVVVANESPDWAEIAVQGPKAQELLQRLTDYNLDDLHFFHCKDKVRIDGAECLVSRTGYTGEDGFEVYMKPEDAVNLWESMMKAGEDFGVSPCGLGSRDSLRFEACLPLYGHELSRDITPLEASLGFFVKLDKADFIGKQALAAQKAKGLTRRMVGVELIERGIPRNGYKLLSSEGAEIGWVTSGLPSPTLGKFLAMAQIAIDYAKVGTEIAVSIRDKACKAVVVKTPFYKKAYKKD
ncbi:MAG TPA: glycine cleavage system aminomethyltransferase GcvT [Bacillota bacterium]|nr:glycine cleavage system aminomethyltransferase GcvT [Bacillota bacterium]HOH09459.1 glycine cleavage system aminomethyltransferase GcvT [Bacillota bacterium]HOS49997.1 glycine cleavage system aminomethyltransferase GcvT [Bacillota bacterium]HOY88154.1 glycine cleavage system aminomethyltransferase GcvT [Bacillota bacterium]HPI00960.1 glycine cleavage system aminomethyltransferase GcvT [Bacillota bacterium]